MPKVIYKFDELMEGKVFKVTYSNFSRNDPSHWSNWYWYVYKADPIDPILFGYYYDENYNHWTGVNAHVKRATHAKTIRKQLFKMYPIEEQRRFIMSACMRGALIYDV